MQAGHIDKRSEPKMKIECYMLNSTMQRERKGKSERNCTDMKQASSKKPRYQIRSRNQKRKERERPPTFGDSFAENDNIIQNSWAQLRPLQSLREVEVGQGK
jgi:hypothetical protein